MKRSLLTLCVLVPNLLLTMFFHTSKASHQERKLEELAHRIVSTSASVKPGEVVVIEGGKHTIPLMEAIAIEAQKAGGIVTMLLDSDKVIRSRNMDIPDQYLDQQPKYLEAWFRQIDVFIGLPAASDIKALDAGVPVARLAKLDKAGQFLTPLLGDMKFREVDITYPTEERAASWRIEPQTYMNMLWDAIGADYQQISERGNSLKKMLQGAKSVRITSPAGTDLTFAAGNRPIFVAEGVVTAEEAKSKNFLERTAALPDGTLTLAPMETSAQGKVVVPLTLCRFERMTNVSFDLKNGKMENFKAADGKKCLNDLMASSAGPVDMIASFQIGLNPGFKIHEENGAAYHTSATVGMVTVGFGDNQLLGGSNKTEGNFGFAFPIVNATVWVDGAKIIENGHLQP